MYQIGDLIYYGSAGTCRITDISEKKNYGMTKEELYYTIKPLYQECLIYAPVNNTKVFMRPILSREEAERLIDKIPTIDAKAFYGQALNQLTQHYEGIIKSHDCGELMELTMSIYAKKKAMEAQKRKFGAIDEKFMKKAEELLFSELSAALEIPRDSVQGYIENRVGSIVQN